MRIRGASTYSIFLSLLLVSCLLLPMSITKAQIVDSVDTPYTKDEHSRLLLHFNDSLETQLKTRVYGDTSFLKSEIDKFKTGLVLDNDRSEDSTYVTVEDTSVLDLTGSWTMEAWFGLFVPVPACTDELGFINNKGMEVLWSKAHEDTSSINYKTYIDACAERIITEYTPVGGSQPARFISDTVSLKDNYNHLAIIRDTSAQRLTIYLHHFTDHDKVILRYKKSWQISSELISANSAPLRIGWGPLPNYPTAEPLGLYGIIDEFRISDTVRTYARSTNIADPVGNVPEKFQLKQNYPNPFNPSTIIRFSLPQSEQVSINVYNTIGQKIETLVNRQMTAGFHSVTFNAEGLPSGVYIYRLKAGEYSESRKMLLVK